MRKQYHLKRVDGVLHAWDVHRLIELTRDLPVEKVNLEDIKELDEHYWFEYVPTCRDISVHVQLCNEADLTYPVILFSSGRVMDGMHRVVKALLEGREYISAVRFKDDPQPDYINIEADKLPYDN